MKLFLLAIIALVLVLCAATQTNGVFDWLDFLALVLGVVLVVVLTHDW